jgi:hypothetical protein
MAVNTLRESKFKAIDEPWSEYQLPDGTVVHARAVVKGVHIHVGPDGKDIVDDHGLPAVNVHTEVQVQTHTKPEV